MLQVSTYPITGNLLVRNSAQFAYDPAQRLTSLTHPDGKQVVWFYTGGKLYNITDEAGNRTYPSFCPACGALTGLSGPLGWYNGWTYDGDGDLIRFRDARIKFTDYAYGAGKELTRITYPDASAIQFLYNNTGQVRQITNARNRSVSLSYDSRDRLSQIAFPTSGGASLGYAYFDDDTLQSLTDGLGATTLTYTPGGQVATVTYHYAASGLAAVQTLEYAYNPDGSRDGLVWKSGGQVVARWDYGYDAGGRLISLSNHLGQTTTWTYDGEGKLTGQFHANGTSVGYQYYQARGWPSQIVYSGPGGNVFASYGLSYDGGLNTVGNLTGVMEATGSVTYGYDALYRLTSETRAGQHANAHSHAYDLAGNRTLLDGLAFSFDAANKLTGTPSGSATHDGDGNLLGITGTNIPSATFSFDDRDKLTGQTSGGLTSSYGYDGFGRRVRSSGNGVTTFYVFDGDLLLGEMDAATGAVRAVYTWGAGGLVSQHLPATQRSLWYAFGPQGETRQLTDANGAVVDTYIYTAYGVPGPTTGSDPNPFRYGGQVGYYTDTSVPGGLILCGARWYNPALARWISRDPIGYEGGDNLYAYCYQDPIGILDPFGMDGWDWIHGLLDGIGIVDPTGIADGANAFLYACKSDWGNAGIAAASILPAGDALKGLKYSKKASDALAVTKNVATPVAAKRAPNNPNGSLGKPSTRAQDKRIADILEKKGWRVTHGGGRNIQEHLRPPCGGMQGAARPDITAIKGEEIMRINTVSTLKDGKTMTKKERIAAERIRALRPNDRFIIVPKKR